MISTKHRIIIGDSRNMFEVKNDSVHLIITSPPYWQLKDYGNGAQIGYNDTYEEYINNLNLVWNECYRVLSKGCRLCINIGDQFARSVYYGRYKIIPIRTEIIKFCETIGFDYMGAVIWQKVTTCNTTGGATVMGSYPYPRNGILKLDYEFILIFKKLGEAPQVLRSVKEKSKLSQEEWNEYFSGHWNFAGEKQGKHLAVFPEELPKRLIKMFSFVGDTVLDPFLGSGTTSLAVKNLNRNSIGYELNQNSLPIIKEKLGISGGRCPDNGKYEIIKQTKVNTNFSERIQRLPYIFKDPLMFNKKIDPKKLRFGSKIDNNYLEREQYYTVKEVLTPNKLILDNNLKIRLIGVREKRGLNGESIETLKNLIKGNKVFLKFDRKKFDEEGSLFCYLYLKNKIFINAYLLKKNLAEVDIAQDYKFKDKFISYVS